MKEIFERTRFLEIQDYPRDWRDCIKQAMSEFNDEVRDAVNQFDISYEEFYDNCTKCYPKFKSSMISSLWA